MPKQNKNKWNISIVCVCLVFVSIVCGFHLRYARAFNFQFDVMSYKSLFLVFFSLVFFWFLFFYSCLVKLYKVFFIWFYPTINLLVRHHCFVAPKYGQQGILQDIVGVTKCQMGSKEKCLSWLSIRIRMLCCVFFAYEYLLKRGKNLKRKGDGTVRFVCAIHSVHWCE